FLRRELHAAGDQVEPRPDGLERIRARVGSASAGRAHASRRSFTQLLSGSAGSAGRGRRGRRTRRTGDWRDGLLRPALGLACALFVIAIALAVPPLRQAIGQLSASVTGQSSSSQATRAPSGGGPVNAKGTGAAASGAASSK